MANFSAAKRDNSKKKRERRRYVAVLLEYIKFVKKSLEEEILNLAVKAVKKLKLERKGIYMKNVIKSLLEALDGKSVKMAIVSRIVREVIRVHSE